MTRPYVLHIDQDLVAALATQTAMPVWRGFVRITRTAPLLLGADPP